MKNIAIFASGTGSNATKIVDYFSTDSTVNVALIVSNKSTAKVLKMAEANSIPTLLIKRKQFYDTEDLLTQLVEYDIDFIALAGFLWLIPAYLVQAFSNKIINIHPALLPKYGGKGFYGKHVHAAVKASKDRESGITLHYVNEQYDEGSIIFQAACPVHPSDSASDIAHNVLQLEHYYFPRILAQVLVSI